MKELHEEVKKFYFARCEPEPISEQEQKQLDDLEEKQNKEKERDARKAQKELETRKAKQKAEA